MTIIEEIVRHILKTRFEVFDKQSIDHAKNRIIDVIGCIFVGAESPVYEMLVDLVKEWGGKEESTFLVHGNKVPTQNAAFANSIMASAADFDPAFLPGVEQMLDRQNAQGVVQLDIFKPEPVGLRHHLLPVLGLPRGPTGGHRKHGYIPFTRTLQPCLSKSAVQTPWPVTSFPSR